MPNVMTGYRFLKGSKQKAVELSEKLSNVSYLAVVAQVSPSVVMRMALLEGVEKAEKNYALKVSGVQAALWKPKGTTYRNKPGRQTGFTELISLSVPAWLLDRVDRVAETMHDDPGVSVPVSRSSVLRGCISEGFEILNERYKTE